MKNKMELIGNSSRKRSVQFGNSVRFESANITKSRMFVPKTLKTQKAQFCSPLGQKLRYHYHGSDKRTNIQANLSGNTTSYGRFVENLRYNSANETNPVIAQSSITGESAKRISKLNSKKDHFVEGQIRIYQGKVRNELNEL